MKTRICHGRSVAPHVCALWEIGGATDHAEAWSALTHKQLSYRFFCEIVSLIGQRIGIIQIFGVPGQDPL